MHRKHIILFCSMPDTWRPDDVDGRVNQTAVILRWRVPAIWGTSNRAVQMLLQPLISQCGLSSLGRTEDEEGGTSVGCGGPHWTSVCHVIVQCWGEWWPCQVLMMRIDVIMVSELFPSEGAEQKQKPEAVSSFVISSDFGFARAKSSLSAYASLE